MSASRRATGGTLEKAGVTEVTSSVYRDGRDVPHHLALGTYVVFEGDSDYARRCFKEYAMLPDKSGQYAALYRPIHMIGLELGISVASAALRGEPTGAPTGFRSDVVATAKRDLKAGEMLDGEGGFCVWGKQTPAARSLADGLLPLGLAHKVEAQARHPGGRCAEMDATSTTTRTISPSRCGARWRRRSAAPRVDNCGAALGLTTPLKWDRPSDRHQHQCAGAHRHEGRDWKLRQIPHRAGEDRDQHGA